MVHDRVNVRDDALLRGRLDRFEQVILGTPLGTGSALLFKLSQVPDVIAMKTLVKCVVDVQLLLRKVLTYHNRFHQGWNPWWELVNQHHSLRIPSSLRYPILARAQTHEEANKQ